MKKLIFVVSTVLFLATIVTSCSEDNNDGDEKFSTLSVEDNKAIVEDAGIDFIHAMGRMMTIETIDVIDNLESIISSSGTKGFLFSEDSKLFSTLETFVATAKGEKKVNDMFDSMTSSKGITEDPESIQAFWDDNVGTYTWNTDLNDWDKVLGGDKIIFKFPSSGTAATNDATLTVHSYTGVNISNPIDDDYTGDLPASLNADLKVGSITLVTFLFGASYNTDGVPNAVAADLTVENFKFEVDIANTTTVVSVNYKLLENTTVIIDMGASGAGLFTEDNYNDNTITNSEEHTYTDWIYNPVTQQYEETLVTYTDEWEETEFEEIINSASAHFQLYNIAIKGDIDIKGMVDQIKLIEEDYDDDLIDEATADNLLTEKINEFLNLRLVNVTNNEIMAKAEAYVVNDVYEQDTYIDFRLVFNDGSPIDVETYFNNGFDDFIDELNSFIYDMNSDFDMDIDPVDY